MERQEGEEKKAINHEIEKLKNQLYIVNC